MLPLKVRIAFIINLVINLFLVLMGRYRLSYDAYTHMLFADHYRNQWWSLWDVRWYAGFTVASYPPLVHQVIGLISHVVSIDSAYALVLLCVLSIYPLVIYRFARIFVSTVPASYACLASVVLPSIYLAAYIFGQLPTLTATLFSLSAAVCLDNFIRTGNIKNAVTGILLVGCTMSAHHATLLLLPFLALSVVLHNIVNLKPARLIPPVLSIRKIIYRSGQFIISAMFFGFMVVWPFWVWGFSQSMQTPIDHASRHNFFQDGTAALIFFWAIYGPLCLLIPYVILKLRDRHFFPFGISVLFLFTLGLGGTTPLPSLFFGKSWLWLTYDRFSYWASLLLLPFLGTFIIACQHHFARVISRRWLRTLSHRLAQILPLAILATVALADCLLPAVLPTQPAPINMKPITDFLSSGSNSQWRYVTFGFGDQFAYLNRITTATTIDGSYHTARELPELRWSGIGQIDTALWTPQGLKALPSILRKASELGVRWGFVNNIAYIPTLKSLGWFRKTTLINGVQVWENPAAGSPRLEQKPIENPFETFWWGCIPISVFLLTLICASILGFDLLGVRLIRGIQNILIGIFPVSISFWYFHQFTNVDLPRVYFIYNNALIFLSDIIAGLIVIAGLALHLFERKAIETKAHSPLGKIRFMTLAFFTSLVFLSIASIIWSLNRDFSVYVCIHLCFLLLVVQVLTQNQRAWVFASIGFCAALGLQILTGFWEVIAQNTQFLAPLKMKWPGILFVSQGGSSVVQRLDGTRWLRAYGTFPHPNILGVFLIPALASIVLLFIFSKNFRIGLLIIFSAGCTLLILTFSRSSWIGFSIFFVAVLLKRKYFPTRRLIFLAIAGLLTITLALLLFHDQLFVRVVNAPVATEEFSVKARNWLGEQSLIMILENPLLGTGVGAFVTALSRRAPIGYIVEPVHNVLFLIINELGLFGGLCAIGLALCLLWLYVKLQEPLPLLFLACSFGLFISSFFDHNLWTLAPSRILFAMILGFALSNQQNIRGFE